MQNEGQQILELSVVALLDDMPEHGLRRGQIGTAIDEVAPGEFDVEFSDAFGRTVRLLPLPVEKLMGLYRVTPTAPPP